MWELDTIIEQVLLSALVKKDFRSGHPAVVGDEGESDDEISIKLSQNQQKACWSYDKDLEKRKIVGEKQNKCVWAVWEREAKEFKILFVCPIQTDWKLRIVDENRNQKLSKEV